MKHDVNIKKASSYAVVINALQILMVLAITLYVFFSDEKVLHMSAIRFGMLGAALVVCWGAVVDIREAIDARKTISQVVSMEKTMQNIENLNYTLRAQRHDFLNHLQVVYSLMEMEEYKEAGDYIERVYGDISAVSRVMRTANPAVNALLKVKVAAFEEAHVEVELDITSPWENLPVPGWEMCRILANLLDNALDAVKETEMPQVKISLSEDLKTYRFAVTNNGPVIPINTQNRIFMPGVTTKSHGQGMGLFIVRRLLRQRGGDIALESNNHKTTFFGYIPKDSTLLEESAELIAEQNT